MVPNGIGARRMPPLSRDKRGALQRKSPRQCLRGMEREARWALLALLAGQSLANIDTAIVNVAMPSIQG